MFNTSRCISLYSYIKPQPRTPERGAAVVYLYTPTSNHNWSGWRGQGSRLYIFILLHQTTTGLVYDREYKKLYIFILLHQTTTASEADKAKEGCISLYSYIKPQQHDQIPLYDKVVYLYTPTSNHNYSFYINTLQCVVYLYTPTSNHNSAQLETACYKLYIFILLHQTTTIRSPTSKNLMLYIFILLHQTTTNHSSGCHCLCCISLYSYIKPQQTPVR